MFTARVFKMYCFVVLILNVLKNQARNICMPSICAYCKRFLSDNSIFCTECRGKIFPIVSKKIDITSRISATVFALSDYKDPLKRLILAKSWSDSLASYQMGQLLCESIPFEYMDCDIIVPIPLHWTRYAWRGFNQADEIARVISKRKNIPIHHLLKRVKKTAFQSALVSSMRAQNLKEAFALNTIDIMKFHDKHIVLVDDLMTTGSTLRVAAKVLLVLKPKKITIVVVCRVV